MTTWNACTDPSPGYDLAHWQGTKIDFPAARALGIEWVIAKTWHGKWPVTSQAEQLAAARRAGIDVLGRYGWFLPDDDLDTQIDAWTLVPRAADELPLSIDHEHPDTPLRGGKLVARLEYVIERVSDRIGCRPIVYTGEWYWKGFCLDVDSEIAASCPLWLAAYPRKAAGGTRYQEAIAEVCGGVMPRVPKPWRDRGIEPLLWQFDGDRGLYLPGGAIDVDVNTAAREQLRALRRGPAPSDAPATKPQTPSSMSMKAVREPIADLSLDSPATPLRAPEAEHTVKTEDPEL